MHFNAQVVYGLDFEAHEQGRQLALVRNAIQEHMANVKDAIVVSMHMVVSTEMGVAVGVQEMGMGFAQASRPRVTGSLSDADELPLTV
eukprot:1160373-Pelagomonas_calceolata.AAC.16